MSLIGPSPLIHNIDEQPRYFRENMKKRKEFGERKYSTMFKALTTNRDPKTVDKSELYKQELLRRKMTYSTKDEEDDVKQIP